MLQKFNNKYTLYIFPFKNNTMNLKKKGIVINFDD